MHTAAIFPFIDSGEFWVAHDHRRQFLSDTCGSRVCKKGITLRRSRSSSRDEGGGRSCNPKRPACQWRWGVQTPLTLVVSTHLIFGFTDWKRDSALWRKSSKSLSWGWLHGKTGILFCSLCLFVSSYICWLKLLNNTIVVIKRSECVRLLLGNQWAWPLAGFYNISAFISAARRYNLKSNGLKKSIWFQFTFFFPTTEDCLLKKQGI